MKEELFRIILLIIPVLCAIITGYLVPFIQSKIERLELDKIMYWVDKVVNCAEQILTEGDAKKKFCFNFLEKMNERMNWGLTPEQINILIESVVYNLW